MSPDFDLVFEPVTPERCQDLEALFGPRGAIGGCWCMWWRIKRKEFESQQGEGNHKAMRSIIESGKVPGILAYKDGVPIAWCSVAPREDFPVLEFSAIVLRAAVECAGQNGARIVEGYPIEPKKDSAPDIYVFTGMLSTFQKAGFVEVMRRSESRPIMRYYLED
jgi:hypothetical protein